MKKSIKIWLIVLCSLLGLGLVFCIVGAVMGGRLYNAARLMAYGPWGRHIETVVNSDQWDHFYRPYWWDHDYDDFDDYRKEQAQYWKDRRDEWREEAREEAERWDRDWDWGWDRRGNHGSGEHCRSGYRTARFASSARNENRSSCYAGNSGLSGCGSRHWENGGHCSRNSRYSSERCAGGWCENESSCWNTPRFQVNTGNGLVY